MMARGAQGMGASRALLIGIALMALVTPPAAGSKAARVIQLPDDTETRGDWIGAYGNYVYVLCGMRSPYSFYGGPGWPMPLSFWTSDPDETVRAWLSSAPAHGNRSVLLEPNGLRRTQAVFDDHGETRPIGTGPDLHLSVPVPEGPHLLSMYFFEVDWIQYRDYPVKIYDKTPRRNLLAETRVANFFKGKYARFAILGPLEIEVVIERGQSPNATLSGLFLDRLAPPQGSLLKAFGGEANRAPIGIEAAVEQAESALKDLGGAPSPENASKYLQCEAAVLDALHRLSRQPEQYLAEFYGQYRRMSERINTGLNLTKHPTHRMHLLALGYYASRGACDFAGARLTFSRLMEEAGGMAKSRANEFPVLYFLRRACVEMLKMARPPEAELAARAYGDAVLKRLDPGDSLDAIVSLGEKAIRGAATKSLAGALERWEREHGLLNTEHSAMLAALYYASGKYGKAREVLPRVERAFPMGPRHRWALVALITSHLNEDDFKAAENALERLTVLYPDSVEITEARYRFAVRRFERREWGEAERIFRDVIGGKHGGRYAKMCNQYIERMRRGGWIPEEADE